MCTYQWSDSIFSPFLKPYRRAFKSLSLSFSDICISSRKYSTPYWTADKEKLIQREKSHTYHIKCRRRTYSTYSLSKQYSSHTQIIVIIANFEWELKSTYKKFLFQLKFAFNSFQNQYLTVKINLLFCLVEVVSFQHDKIRKNVKCITYVAVFHIVDVEMSTVRRWHVGNDRVAFIGFALPLRLMASRSSAQHHYMVQTK